MQAREIVNSYFELLKENIVYRDVAGWTEITLPYLERFPYLDRHNDRIQLYLRKSGDIWELTDDGETLRNLIRWRWESTLKKILNGTAVVINGSRLSVFDDFHSMPLRIRALLRAIDSINLAVFSVEKSDDSEDSVGKRKK